MSRGPTAATLLGRALAASSRHAGAPIALIANKETPWRSATFSGSRHQVEGCAQTSAALDRWLATVADIDLPLAGHMLAEARIGAISRSGGETRFTLAALTVAAA